MYGRGKVLLKDVNVEIISKDEEAEKKWFTEQIKALSGTTPSINGNENIIDLHKKLIFSRSQKLSKAANWGILTTHSMAKVLRDKPFLHPFTQTIELDIARHEYEGVQICIFTKNEDLKNVKLSIDGLKGPGEIDKAHVEILPVAYGNASKMPEAGFFSPQSSDWLPDALLSNRSFNVEKGTVQPVYIRFYVPRNTIPGKYTGSLSVNSNSGKASVPVTLNVSSYTLPTRLTLKTMLLGGKGARSEDKAYLDLALQNRMPPGKIFTGMSWTNPSFPRQGKTYDFTDVEKRLQYAIDRGLNSFALCTTAKSGKFGFPKEYSQEWKKKMSHIVREYSAFLEKKGWLDMAYYYNIDEPWNTRWNQVKEIYDMVKKVNPKIKVLSCVNKVGALEALKNHAD
ncbi:MAG: DUF6067 family protein, partial [Lentisphaeraceae bacterium]|nr:DUF6067 family protein [Lentisphaeraceae bacterium]